MKRTLAITNAGILLAAGALAQPAAPQLPRFAVAPGPAQTQIRSGFSGSVRGGKATAETLALTLEDALARGLKYNLGGVQSGLDVESRRAERLGALSRLLPNVALRPALTESQLNLSTFGFSFPGTPSVVGPFTVVDLRGYVTQPVLDFPALRGYRAKAETVKAGQSSYRDAREQVVFTVVTLYLQALSGASRIDAAKAQVASAEALYRRAVDRKEAGTAPAIDVLRAQVQLQTQQQRLIYYEGEFDKQKLSLARAAGLPAGQALTLADPIPDSGAEAELDVRAEAEEALKQRADYQAAQSRVRAAELEKSAARGGRLPSAGFVADYGTNGPRINDLHGSFTLAASLTIPIYQGRRVEAEVLAADTELRQRRAELEELEGRIENEVYSAGIDLRSAARQLQVARGNLDLARRQLEQSQDRFTAGVTNNVEVVQAQEAVATANENLISSLYAVNAAKAQLARARGDAERGILRLLKGNR
jgi:outer membrane protein TolC